jgi:two-component SAPR family response regulator
VKRIAVKQLSLVNKRVMVVEDEYLVSMLIEDTLADNRCSIVGPYATLSEALAAAKVQDVDIALLDVNLRGEKVYPVADLLSERGIPFILLSGYGKGAIPNDRPDWTFCCKPFTPEELAEALKRRLLDSA